MRKSILSIFVTLSMLFSLIPSVFAADNVSAAYTITPDKTTVEQGDIVTFSFAVDKVELASSLLAKIKYDPTKLVYMSSERGPIYNYDYTAGTGKTLTHADQSHAIGAMLSFNKDEYHDINNTVFFKATFMVAADAEQGSYDDYITVNEFKAYRDKTSYNLKGSVPTLTVEAGDPSVQSYPLLVKADKTSVEMGSDVTYTISTKDPISLSGIQMLLDYDRELLEFKNGTLLEGDTSVADADGIVWAVDKPQTVQGTIATLTFTALKNGIANITAETESGPVALKAAFPSVAIISDVNIKVAPDKESASENDTLVYTVTLSEDVSVTGLQISLDFSDLDITECKAALGSSLESIEAHSNEVAFEKNVATIVFANGELTDIQAGVLAEFSFKLGSDVNSAYIPKIAENAITYETDGSGFSADVEIVPLKATPVTAVLSAVPNVTTAQAGDFITYTVSFDKAVTIDGSKEKGFEAHLYVDPEYVDGDVTVKKLTDNEAVSAEYNAAKHEVVVLGAGVEESTVSGDIVTFTFKTKASKNVVLTPVFTEIVTTPGLTLSGVVTPVSIFVESSATVNISSSTEFALPGNTVVYTIDLKDAKALKILNIDVNYDPELYTDAKVNAAEASPLTSEVSKSAGKINVRYMGESAFAGDKDGLVTIEFKVAADPKSGSDGVTVDVKSDPDTKLTVNNNAKTSIVSNYGHIVLNTSTDYMYYNEFLDVAVAAEDAAELTNLSFELTFDKDMFSRVSVPVVSPDGAQCNIVEEGRIRYVYTGEALGTDNSDVMGSIRLYPYGVISGYSEIKVADVASTSPVDSVKASKTIYVYSKEETKQILAVRDAINAIGDITADNFLSKEIKAVTARALYDNLADVQKHKLVEDLKVLEAAEAAIAGYKEASAAVDALIDAIGDVTAENFLEKIDAIQAAENAYAALTNAQKACVTKYEDLKKARELYNGFRIAAVRDAINAIGEITGDNFLTKEEKAITARALYDDLADEQKPNLAEDLKVLEAAEAAIAGYKEACAAVDALINAIGDVTAENFLEKGDAIQAAENAYKDLTNTQKECVTKYEDLKKARELYDGFFAALKNFKVTLAKTADGYTATVVNQKSASDDPAVVLAVYDKEGVLVSIKAIQASKADSVSYTGDTTNTTAEVYVWNSIDKMVPYTDVEIVK